MFQRIRTTLACAWIDSDFGGWRVINGYLRKLSGRFPERELEIVRLARDNPSFRSICEELEMAEAAHARWKGVPDRASEYREILERLEEEFMGHLSGNACPAKATGRKSSGD